MFGNNVVAVRKIKAALKPNKPAYVEMCISNLSKVLMHEFHYDSIKISMVTSQDYFSLTLIV